MRVNLEGVLSRLRKYRAEDIINAIAYVLGGIATSANVHDSKGAIPLPAKVLHDHVKVEHVKSNFGTPDFIPIEGRWVVERTFSWMENYRRLTRNYEKLLKVAAHMFIAGCVFFMLRYF